MAHDSDHRPANSPAGNNKPGKTYLTANQVRYRYGRITSMTLYRWVRREKMHFPQPEYINGLRYWNVANLDVWDNSRTSAEKPVSKDDDDVADEPAAPTGSDDP